METNCYGHSPYVSVPEQPLANLPYMELTGETNIQFMESNNSEASASCGASGIETNITAPEPSSDGSYTTYGSPPTIDFTEYLYDSDPNAQIYWTVAECSGYAWGDNPMTSGDSFTLEYQSEYDCNPSGTMYAQAPGYLPSPPVYIDFP